MESLDPKVLLGAFFHTSMCSLWIFGPGLLDFA
jgi:hypothetical protein